MGEDAAGAAEVVEKAQGFIRHCSVMCVFGGLIVITVVAVIYSKFRPLNSVLPPPKASDAAVASPSRDKQAEEQRIPPLPPAPR